MKIADYFDKTYIINLPERTDRLWMIRHELKRAGIPLTPGKAEIFPGIRSEAAGVFPNAGIRGCFLSHLAILKQAQKEGLNNILIAEDDLAISDYFIKNEPTIVEELKDRDWGIVYLGHILKLKPIQGFELEPFEGRIWTTHWYGVRRSALGPLIDFLDAWQTRPDLWRIFEAADLDGALSVFRQMNPGCRTLVANPCLGWQKSSRSDVSVPKFFDRTPALRELATAVRIIKSLLIRKRRIGW